MHRRVNVALRPAALVTALALGGCGSLGGLGQSTPVAYDLGAAQFAKRIGGRSQMVVAEPTALPVIDSEKIVVRPSSGEVATMAGAQWQERLPRLMQQRLVQSFENAGRLRSVGKSGDRLSAGTQLIIDIRAFELAVESSSAEIEVSAKIVNGAGRVMAAHVFRASAPASGTDGAAAAAALNAAFARIATDVVMWSSRVA